jgi:hypothetical protein
MERGDGERIRLELSMALRRAEPVAALKPEVTRWQ